MIGSVEGIQVGDSECAVTSFDIWNCDADRLKKLENVSLKMFNNSIERHKVFKEEKWGGNEAFHDEEHIKAVIRAVDTYFDSLIKGMVEDDPLQLVKSLQEWNKKSFFKITIPELREVMKMSFADHDRGNQEELVDGNLRFLNKYVAGKVVDDSTGLPVSNFIAEQRSQQIYEYDLKGCDLINDPCLDLGKELIIQTIFIGEMDKPFARASRVFDQIGNGMFTEKNPAKMFRALAAEWGTEDENADSNNSPYDMINFDVDRLKQLIPDETERNKFLNMMGIDDPDEYMNREIILEKDRRELPDFRKKMTKGELKNWFMNADNYQILEQIFNLDKSKLN